MIITYLLLFSLHLNLLQQPIPEYTVDQINTMFRKFGAIESIEMLPNQKTEAYVTFVSDRSAYLAYLQCAYLKKDGARQRFDIQPADSWQQPRENANTEHNDMDIDERIPEIFMLNDDCLLHMFTFLDLDSLVNSAYVCKRFRTLLIQRFFPKIHKYTMTNESNPNLTLAKMRRTMLCIGPYITDLTYESDCDEESNRTTKFLRVIAENIGSKIRRASLSLVFDKNDHISILKPIFKQLESLRIVELNEDCEPYDIDFHALCPKLMEFEMIAEMPMIATCKPWKTLKCLSVPEFCVKTKTLISFIKQNPQLTSLTFHLPDTNRRIVAINKYLPDLEKISITFRYGSNTVAENFVCLVTLHHLSEIELRNVPNADIHTVISHLLTFTSLRKINLFAQRFTYNVQSRDYNEPLIRLAKLPQLKDLKLSYIAFNEATLLDVIGFGNQLETLYIDNCVEPFTDALVSNIAEACKFHRPSSSGALRLYLRKYVLNKLNIYQIQESARYVQMKDWVRN